jgi:transcriptional regulator NrdR family protein
MECPHCRSTNSRCTNSRPTDHFIRRRRECYDCGERWSTVEINEEEYNNLRNITLVSAQVFIGGKEVTIGLKGGK